MHPQKICSMKFTAALFIIAKKMEITQMPMNCKTSKMCHQIMVHYLTTKKNEVLMYGTT